MMNRQGPKPLALHIGIAGAHFQNNESAGEKLSSMINGIQLYQRNEYTRQASGFDVVWQSEQTSLRHIKPNVHKTLSSRNICLLIPSIINGSEILDLSPERSLAQFMINEGFESYILDWGNLCADQDDLDLEILIKARLVEAILHLTKTHPDCKIHILGYCMGGAMALGASALMAQQNTYSALGSLTLLATPWNFHVGHMNLLNRIRYWAPSALTSVQSRGYLSSDYLQSLFASVDPSLTQSKFSGFAKMDQSSERAKVFIAVEDWLNDGRDLPEDIANECIVEWFLKNKPASGAWNIDGQTIDPAILKIPVLIVASRKDRLVEYDCAIDVQNHISHADTLEPDCGHIGMIAGEKSIQQVWKPIAEWIKKH